MAHASPTATYPIDVTSPTGPATHSIKSTRLLLLTLLLCGYAMALSQGHLAPPVLAWLALLMLAGFAVRPGQPPIRRYAGHALFILLATALALHLLPGFDNARVLDQVTLSPGALPFSLYLNLDKPLVAAWLLLACPWVVAAHNLKQTSAALTQTLPVTLAVVLGLALSLGVVTWHPAWPPSAWLWAASNLLLTCITEEALFRGYIQGGLQRCGGRAARLALPIAALLFGLAHVAGGWQWVLLATLAGVGYGQAYQRGGLPASIAAHFLLNLAHFGLFTYPMLRLA